eukprot:c25315_g2_i1 orf=1-267(-)
MAERGWPGVCVISDRYTAGSDILLKEVGQAFASLASSLTALIEREELEANQNLHKLEAKQELHAKQEGCALSLRRDVLSLSVGQAFANQ